MNLKKHTLGLVSGLVLAGFSGCLGERYEANVPVAELDLWDDAPRQARAGDPGYGFPRFIESRQSLPDRGSLPRTGPRGSLPGFRGSLPRRGSLPWRGTMPGRPGTLPDRGSLPRLDLRGSLPR